MRPHQPTPAPHMKGDNGRQDHVRAQEANDTNQHPPPTWRETTGDNGRQDHFRAQNGDHINQHPTPTWRVDNQTTGDKTTSEPKMAATPTNTHPPHKGRQQETTGDNGRQNHFRAQEADHTNQDQGGQI